MTYTKGVRKILDVLHYRDINNLKEIAKTTGHEAFLHNGDVYILNKETKEWIETPFTINDFSTGRI